MFNRFSSSCFSKEVRKKGGKQRPGGVDGLEPNVNQGGFAPTCTAIFTLGLCLPGQLKLIFTCIIANVHRVIPRPFRGTRGTPCGLIPLLIRT
jgi:hypothetical protein